MRLRQLMVPVFVAALALARAAATTTTTMRATPASRPTAGGAKLGDDTGTVNLMRAGEPEEVEAYQEIFDELINAEADYNVEIESSGNFEEQFQIRAEGGTLDVAAVPQPGLDPGARRGGRHRRARGHRLRHRRARTTLLGESFVALGEYEGKHYGLPTNINLKSMVWYPKDAFDAAGYTVPETWDELIALSDQIVADGSTPWCVGFESEGATRLAGDRLDGRHHAPHRGRRRLRPVVQARDPVQRPRGQGRGRAVRRDHVQRRLRPRWRGGDRADIAFGDAPLPMFEDPPDCWLHRQASFINAVLPGRRGSGRRLRLVPAAARSTRRARCTRGELTVVGTTATGPR